MDIDASKPRDRKDLLRQNLAIGDNDERIGCQATEQFGLRFQRRRLVNDQAMRLSGRLDRCRHHLAAATRWSIGLGKYRVDAMAGFDEGAQTWDCEVRRAGKEQIHAGSDRQALLLLELLADALLL